MSTSETLPEVWLAVSRRSPAVETARAIGERCGSSVPARAPGGRLELLSSPLAVGQGPIAAMPIERDAGQGRKLARAESTLFVMKIAPASFDRSGAASRPPEAVGWLDRTRRRHIRSTISIPRRPSPNFKVLAVRSQSASRLSRRSGDSAFEHRALLEETC